MSILKNIKREWTYLSFLLPVLSKTNKLDKNPNLTVADLIEEQVDDKYIFYPHTLTQLS